MQYGATGRSGDPSHSAEKIRTFIIPRFPSVFNAFNAGGAAYSPVTVYRIWGGAVNPEGDDEQVRTARRIADCGYSGVSSLYYQPEGGESLGCAVDRHKLRDKARARSGCADDPARLTSHLTHANSVVRIVNAVSATPAPFAVKRGHRKRRAPATSTACGRWSKPERVARENYSALPHRGKPSDNRHYVTSSYVNGKARGTIALHSMKSPPNLCRDTDADTTTQQKTDGQSRRSCLCRCAVG